MRKGKIRIRKDELVKDIADFKVDAVLVRFTNLGQSIVVIDEQEYLMPGESFVEADIAGEGIEHHYQIDFIQNNTGSGSATPLPFQIYQGNKLKIRTLRRQHHGQI